jgi:hypothetical protein
MRELSALISIDQSARIAYKPKEELKAKIYKIAPQLLRTTSEEVASGETPYQNSQPLTKKQCLS